MTARVEPKEVVDLFTAIRAKDARRVGELLNQDPRLANTKDRDGMGTLITAAYHRASAIVPMLLRAGAEPDLFACAALGLAGPLSRLLSVRPECLQEFSPDGWTALHLAAHFGEVETIRVLLARGADVSTISRNAIANEPLQAAVASGSVEAARVLLEGGARVNARSHGQFTALHLAAENGNLRLVRLLKSAGGDPTAKAEGGATPGDRARAKGHPEVARWLDSA